MVALVEGLQYKMAVNLTCPTGYRVGAIFPGLTPVVESHVVEA